MNIIHFNRIMFIPSGKCLSAVPVSVVVRCACISFSIILLCLIFWGNSVRHKRNQITFCLNKPKRVANVVQKAHSRMENDIRKRASITQTKEYRQSEGCLVGCVTQILFACGRFAFDVMIQHAHEYRMNFRKAVDFNM